MKKAFSFVAGKKKRPRFAKNTNEKSKQQQNKETNLPHKKIKNSLQNTHKKVYSNETAV